MKCITTKKKKNNKKTASLFAPCFFHSYLLLTPESRDRGQNGPVIYKKKRTEGYYKPSWLASGKADNVGVENEKVKGV